MLDCIWFFLLLAVAASDALAWQESEKQEIRYVSENEPPVLAAEAAAKPVYRVLREEN
jgi:tryptophan-rich sensory protein